MTNNKSNLQKLIFCIFSLLLLTDSFSQPLSPGTGGRKLGQSEHFNPPGPPNSPAPLSTPPNYPPQMDFLRPGEPLEIDAPAKELLEQIFIARIANQLKFSDEQTVVFLKKFIDFQKQTKELVNQRKQIAESLRTTLRQKPDEINKGEIAKFYNDLLEIDKKIFEKKRNFIDEVTPNLELDKKAELYLILSDFDEEIKKFLRKAYEWRQRRGKIDKTHTPTAPSLPQTPSE